MEAFRKSFGAFGRPSYADVARSMFPIQELPKAAVPVYMLPQCGRCDCHVEDLKLHTTGDCDLNIVREVLES